MLNFFGNTVTVPNGYVYTSHTGSNYVFLEGLWFNNSSMKMINPSTYSIMYNSAQTQIVEHNSKSKLKIGSTYIREGKECTFIGDKKFFSEGQFFFEADDSAVTVPNGYIYTSGKGKSYYKKGGEWYLVGSKTKVNQSASRPLEQSAVRKIEQENSSNDLKIGKSTWTSSKGKEYTYVGGDRFISADGKMLPKGMAEKAKNDIAASRDDHEEEESRIRDDVDAEVDDTSTANDEDRHQEEREDQEQEIGDTDSNEDEHREEDKIKNLADKIKSNPDARKITVLLTRADKLSLMAADILLSGEKDKVKQIIQSLNNRDE